MLEQDDEIHKQISWEPHGVVTYKKKKPSKLTLCLIQMPLNLLFVF